MSLLNTLGWAPIHAACKGVHAPCLSVLLTGTHFDANLVTADAVGTTPAYLASSHGHVDCLSVLHSQGADLLLADSDGRAPIHIACRNGHSAVLSYLLANGAARDVNQLITHGGYEQEDYGAIPATICSANGHVKCLALVMDQDGAELDGTDTAGNTAAHAACKYDQWRCLLFLINRGAEINTTNADGCTPLDVARKYNHPDCVRLLRRYDAVGMIDVDLPAVSEADKVGIMNTAMYPGAYFLFASHARYVA